MERKLKQIIISNLSIQGAYHRGITVPVVTPSNWLCHQPKTTDLMPDASGRFSA